MTNDTIKIGDPVMDAAQGRAMIVLGAPDQTVEEWSEENNYDLTENYGNEKFNPDPDEPVVRAVYVSDVRSEPTKDYTFPRSRLRLIDAHHADDGRQIHDRIVFDTLQSVFDTLADSGLEHRMKDFPDLLEASDLDDYLVQEAAQLAYLTEEDDGDD